MLAMFALLSLVLVEARLRPRSTASATLNIAARQRTLSQKMAKCVALLASGDIDPVTRRKELEEALKEFLSAHETLRQTHEARQDLSNLIRQIDPIVAGYSRDLSDLLTVPADNVPINAWHILPSILEEEAQFLKLMEQLVTRNAEDDDESVTRSITLLRVLIATLILGLLIQHRTVMLPAVRKIHEQLAQLREKEAETAKLAVVASRTTNAVVISNSVGSTLWVNEAFTRLTGYQLSEVQGRHLTPLLSSEATDEEALNLIREQMQNGQPFNVELANRAKDGREYWVKIDAQPIRDESGEIIQYIMVQTDLTERRKMEQQTKRLLGFQTAILENAPYAIFATGGTGILSLFNPAAERMFGWSASDVVSHESPLAFLSLGDSSFSSVLDRVTDSGLARSQVCEGIRRNGRRFPARVVVAPLRDETRQVAGTIAVVVDITDEIEASASLVAAKNQAEAAARAKAEFLANMSHEIRTPLNAIIGMTGLLLDSPLSTEQRDHAETVRTSGLTLLALINDILDFSKIDAGKMSFERVSFSLRTVAEEVGDLLAQEAHRKGIELILICQHDVPSRVIGDPTRIRQVILNLAANAVKFTQAGEVVVEIGSATPVGSTFPIQISIRDTGIGIAEDKLPQLFTAFSQADNSTTRQFGGTGLGLSISRRLVDMMGGSVTVRSQLGRGSLFAVTIPLEADLAPADPYLRADLKGLRCLVIDDNKTNRTCLRGALELWGCIVSEAESASAALEHLRTAPELYDIALVDYLMPETDGVSLAQVLHRDPALKGIPLLLLTSGSWSTGGTSLNDLGFRSTIPKPVKLSVLHDAIRNTLHGGPATRSGEARQLVTEDLVSLLRRSPGRLLLVEDNLVNQKVAVRLLERAGLRCDIASNGLEAVEAVERFPYDLILMDCQMPEMDGYAATRAIRSLGSDRASTPIIAMTAEALKGDRERCIAAGMDDYMTKPIDPALLYRTIERYLPKADQQPIVQVPMIDYTRLAVTVGSGAEEQYDAIKLFLGQAEAALDALNGSLSGGTNAIIGPAARALRNAAGQVHAERISKLCDQLMDAVRAGRIGEYRDLIGQLGGEIIALRTGLRG
jgi:PAS domain S-box-containing protein